MVRPLLITLFKQVLLPLLVGIAIYLIFRGVPFFGTKSLLSLPLHIPLLSFIVFNFPDGLWLYALLSLLAQIWKQSATGLLWIIGVFILTLCSELFQALHIIRGTFDWLDIATYCFAFFVFCLVYRHQFFTKIYISV